MALHQIYAFPLPEFPFYVCIFLIYPAGCTRFVLQAALPLCFFKAHKNKVFPHQQRALDQHTICGKKLQHFVLRHGRQFIFQLHRFIQQAAGVKKFLQRQAAAAVPCSQFLVCRVFCFDISQFIGNVIFVQPLLRFLAGGAFGVTNKCYGFILL